ncbi:hypothetical protein SEHO0A_01171 [Salmonella enterica subsp. houtenae str. ATCC BAA-1581]|nr:hypothetical protein SEHO0A_01171 [Salmonella enterica subsp. houtenae str. ATCC BAA-1581]
MRLNTCSTDPTFSYRHYAEPTKPKIIQHYRSRCVYLLKDVLLTRTRIAH